MPGPVNGRSPVPAGRLGQAVADAASQHQAFGGRQGHPVSGGDINALDPVAVLLGDASGAAAVKCHCTC